MRSKEKNMDLTSTENEAAKKVKKADKWADKPAMEVRDLHFSYGKNKVLKGVSLKIEEGKITTIMGANGCGKSTLFSLMTKNLYPRKGNIFLKGKNIQNLNLKEFARKVAIVQQYNSASDDITVENLVAFGRTPHKKMMQGDSAEDERMIQWALEVTPDFIFYYHNQISSYLWNIFFTTPLMILSTHLNSSVDRYKTQTMPVETVATKTAFIVHITNEST